MAPPRSSRCGAGRAWRRAAVDQRIVLLARLCVTRDFEAGEQFHIAWWSAGFVHADTLRPGGLVVAAPILGERILRGTLVIEAGLLVAADRDCLTSGRIA